MGLRLVAIATLALCAAACGPLPADPSMNQGRPPTACIGLQPEQCAVIADSLLGEPGVGGAVTFVAVSERTCDGPCPIPGPGAWLGRVVIERAAGRPETHHVEVVGTTVAWTQVDSILGEVEPRSQRTSEAFVEVQLGHCGLASGVDVDGSFWDPVGQIDPTHPDLINAASAEFRRVSPQDAVLTTEGGAVVQLVRHTGPKHLPLCD